MAILEIKIIPDPVLRTAGRPVDTFDATLHRLLDDMYETMVSAHGLGIAAPQVGVSSRVAVIDLSVDSDHMSPPLIRSLETPASERHLHGTRLEIVNPEIVEGVEVVSSEEGCLSIPEYRDSIKRKRKVVVRAHDRHGKRFELVGEDLLAFALQHEIDHLEGILFTDHLSRLKRQLFQRWWNKQSQREAE